MKVFEIFESIQGEGLYSGAITTFVRFAGCSLHCPECDTLQAWKSDDIKDVGVPYIVEVIEQKSTRPRHICITGGEPLEQPQEEMFSLLQTLQGWHGSTGLESVVIETNGSRDVSWLLNKPFRNVTHLSIDYKLPSTGKHTKMMESNFAELGPKDVIKFICRDEEDMNHAKKFLEKISKENTRPVILFHALGGGPAKWLSEAILEWKELLERFEFRTGVQLHKLYEMR